MSIPRSTRVLCRLLAAYVVAACTAGCPLPSLAQVVSPMAAAQTTTDAQGVLVLRNGHVFQGDVRQDGDQLIVTLENGTISVRLGDVAFQCRSLQEAYQLKRERIGFGGAYEHLQLATWCYRQGLTQEAAAELQVARTMEPGHPMIGLVQRQLDASLRKQPTPLNTSEKPRSVPTIEELDLLVRGMPPGTMETFTRTIQPLLTNNCTTSGCHGPGSTSGFQLSRSHPGRPPSRRLTQRNLLATLEFVDQEAPSESPLTRQPTGADGCDHARVFTGSRTVQYQELVGWVHAVAQKHRYGQPASGQDELAAEQRAETVTSAGHLSFDTSSADGVVPAVAEEPPGQTPANPFQLPPDFLPARSEAEAALRGPVDLFDPEIFNRRYFEL